MFRNVFVPTVSVGRKFLIILILALIGISWSVNSSATVYPISKNVQFNVSSRFHVNDLGNGLGKMFAHLFGTRGICIYGQQCHGHTPVHMTMLTGILPSYDIYGDLDPYNSTHDVSLIGIAIKDRYSSEFSEQLDALAVPAQQAQALEYLNRRLDRLINLMNPLITSYLGNVEYRHFNLREVQGIMGVTMLANTTDHITIDLTMFKYHKQIYIITFLSLPNDRPLIYDILNDLVITNLPPADNYSSSNIAQLDE